MLHNSIIYSKNGGVIELVESRKHVTWSQKELWLDEWAANQRLTQIQTESVDSTNQMMMSHKCEKKGGHDWGWLGLFGVSYSRVIFGWNLGGNKMDPKPRKDLCRTQGFRLWFLNCFSSMSSVETQSWIDLSLRILFFLTVPPSREPVLSLHFACLHFLQGLFPFWVNLPHRPTPPSTFAGRRWASTLWGRL